jgi:hypothetical protein
MDEVSARADMADALDDARLAVSVPRDEVERILATDEEVDLVLDVVRTNGKREERRIFLAWDREALRHLVDQGGERIVVAIDPDSLQKALDADVEAHGLREVGATLAIAVTALGGASGAMAARGGEVFEPGVTDFPSITATVDTSVSGAPGAPGAMHAAEAAQAAAAAQEAGMPRAMPSDYAAAGVDAGGIVSHAPGAPGAAYAAEIAAEHAAAGKLDIESVRAGQSVTPTPSADIETVRAGGSAIPDADSAIENVRLQPRVGPGTAGGGGISVDAPSAGVTAALAGGAALTIAAAAFALRRRREPEPAM